VLVRVMGSRRQIISEVPRVSHTAEGAGYHVLEAVDGQGALERASAV
jgi:hypothetical protein